MFTICKKSLPIILGLVLCSTGCQGLNSVDPQNLKALAVEQLQESLNSPVQMQAIEACVELRLPKAPDICMRVSSAPSRKLRFAGAMGLLEMPTPAAAGHLQKLLSDQDESVRLAAIGALHRMGKDSPRNELIEALDSESDEIRGSALTILGRLGEKSAVPAIKKLQETEQIERIRLQAAEALALLGDKNVLSQIQVLANSNDWQDRMIAVQVMGLRQLEHDFAADLVDKLTDPNEMVQLQAARSLGRLGQQDGYEVAVKHLKPSVWVRRNIAAEMGVEPNNPQIEIKISQIRSLAAQALGDIGRWDAARPLKTALGDKDPQVALAAAQGSLRLLIKTGKTPMQVWSPSASGF